MITPLMLVIVFAGVFAGVFTVARSVYDKQVQSRVSRFVAKWRREFAQSKAASPQYIRVGDKAPARIRGKLHRVKRGVRGRLWGPTIVVIERLNGTRPEVILPRPLAREFRGAVRRGSWVAINAEFRLKDVTSKDGTALVGAVEFVGYGWTANKFPLVSCGSGGSDHDFAIVGDVLSTQVSGPDNEILHLRFRGVGGVWTEGRFRTDYTNAGKPRDPKDPVTWLNYLTPWAAYTPKQGEQVRIEADLVRYFGGPQHPQVLVGRTCQVRRARRS